MEQISTNRWNDVFFDLIKTDFLFSRTKSVITISPISTPVITADFIKSIGTPIQTQVPLAIDAGYTDVTISASQLDRPVIVTATATVPANFSVILPNVSDVTQYLTTANTNITLSYGDSFKVSVINLNTNAGHAVFADTTSSDTFVPPQASGANMLLPQTITEFTYIVDPTVTPVSGIVIANLGVSKNYADSQLALHVNNHTDAHFGQDLSSTGSAVFQTVSVSGSATVTGTLNAAGSLAVTGLASVTNTTASTSPTSGALVVSGGAGFGGTCSMATDLAVGGGIMFNLSTGGSLLQYYGAQYLTGAWTGAWTGAGLGANLKLVRIGDLIMITSGLVSGLVGADDIGIFNAALPSAFRPSWAPHYVTWYGWRDGEFHQERTNPANVDAVSGVISIYTQDYADWTTGFTSTLIGEVRTSNFTAGDSWYIDAFNWIFSK